MSIKVIEVKLVPTPEQEETLNTWLKGLRGCWNLVLGEMLILDKYTWYSKIDKQRYPCCPLQWDYIPHQYAVESLRNQKTLKLEPEWIPRCKIPDRCPIDGWYKPVIASFSNIVKGGEGLAKLVSNKYLEVCDRNRPELIESILNVPYCYRKGLIQSLSNAWKEYAKSRSKQNEFGRGRPRFKNDRNPLQTIVDYNPNAGTAPPEKDPFRAIGDYLKIPGLSKRQAKGMHLRDCHVKIKGLERRWRNPDGSVPRIKTFKICKRANGWFVQLTGEVDRSLRLYKRPKGLVALDPGLMEQNWLVSDRGRYAKPHFGKRAQQKKVYWQKKLDEKLYAGLILWLNNPNTTTESIRTVCPRIAKKAAVALLSCRKQVDLDRLVSEGVLASRYLGQLKWRKPLSNRVRDIQERLAKIDRLIADQRRSHQHKISTFLVRRYGAIEIETGVQKGRKRKEAIPKTEGSGFDPNGQFLQTKRNQSLTEAAHGQTIALLESKAATARRRFTKTTPTFNFKPTQQCPCCDASDPKLDDIRVRSFKCPNCGFEMRDRDTKAAVFLAVKAFDRGDVSWDDLSKLARIAIRYRQKIQASTGDRSSDAD